MTNKPMLSVERELLAVVEGFITSQADAFPLINVPRGLRSEGLDQLSKELRALLDKDVDGDSHVPEKQGEPVADNPQCEECKGWGYHENHHEGGGTECGECGGSGNATVAVAVVPDVDELAQIIRKVDGSHTLGAGSLAEAILGEVSKLNGVKP